MILKLHSVSTEQAIPSAGGRHVPALDGLRGLAILMVMFTHYAHGGHYSPLVKPFFALANAGWTGVDLFFVLSGFLITGILLDAKGTPGYFVNFYMRRVLRVFPLYYAVLLAAFVLIPLLAGRLADVGAHSGWLWWYGSNVYTAVHGSTLTPDNLPGWHFGHLWSLAVEEHFYMAWPLVVLLCSRRTLMRLCVVVGLASLATRWALVAHGAGIDVAYQVTVCRLEGLVAGAFLAAAARGDGGLAAWRTPALVLAAAAGAGLAAIGLAHGNVLPDDPLMQRFGYSLLALFYGGLLVLVLLNPSPLARRLFEARPMRFFGKYSYGLYVIHHLWLPMAYAWTTPLAQRSYLLSVVVRLALGVTVSTVLAIGSWHLIERPFLTLKRRFEYGRKPARIRVAEPSVADVPSLVATP